MEAIEGQDPDRVLSWAKKFFPNSEKMTAESMVARSAAGLLTTSLEVVKSIIKDFEDGK